MMLIYFRIMGVPAFLSSEAGNIIQYLRGRRQNNTVFRLSIFSSSFGINSLSVFSLDESLKFIYQPLFRPKLLDPRPHRVFNFNSKRKLSYYHVKMNRTFVYLTLASLCCAFVNSGKSDKVLKFYQEKNFHEAQDLTDEEVRELANLSDVQHFRNTLDQILIPRVVGTPNHEKVGNFIVNEMRGLGWSVTENVFSDQTPVFGTLNFKNIIAMLNPNAERYLVLACHYDSKYTREHVFMGATDSAVPCAMLINLAKVMSSKLEPLKNNKLSLMFIFFDGEEAFRQWGPKDSIYGARHLAKKWQETTYKDGANHLQRMDVLVLLDLLGAPDPVFYSYFQSTEKWYVRLAAAEQKLAELNKLQNYSKGKAEQKYFRLRSSGAMIEDDHIPFLRRNVDILHVIPSPFPSIWHTAGDDITALDFGTIENLNKIFRVFVSEYLHC